MKKYLLLILISLAFSGASYAVDDSVEYDAEYLQEQRFFESPNSMLMPEIRGPEYEYDDYAIDRTGGTGEYKDIITYYIARTIKGAKTVDDIENLIKSKALPEEVRLSAKAIENIKNGLYYLETKGVLEKDDVTIKALMELPLGALEFDEYTTSVLSQDFFSNLASEKEYLGLSRFELHKMENPNLTEQNRRIYSNVNEFFTQDIKNFADEIISQLNEKLDEKLLTEDGNYTEYFDDDGILRDFITPNSVLKFDSVFKNRDIFFISCGNDCGSYT